MLDKPQKVDYNGYVREQLNGFGRPNLHVGKALSSLRLWPNPTHMGQLPKAKGTS